MDTSESEMRRLAHQRGKLWPKCAGCKKREAKIERLQDMVVILNTTITNLHDRIRELREEAQ